MAELNRPVVSIMHLKMSVKSQEFSLLKFGQWLLKYSSLVFLTRLESWKNASWQLQVSTLCRSVTSHCFKLGGPSGVTLDVVLCGGKTSARSGEWCCHLSLGEHSGAGGSPGGRPLSRGGSSFGKAIRMGCQCMSQWYVVGGYQHATEFRGTGS